jgi:hypothetical protein
VSYGEQHFNHLLDDHALAKFVEERTRTCLPPDKPAPSPACSTAHSPIVTSRTAMT